MSSFLGHASTGVALFLGHAPLRSKVARLGLPACVLLAIAPDFDYFAWWLFHANAEPRWTHSLVFALAASSIVWQALRLSGSAARSLPFVLLLAAACSHMVLDLLVGVHPVPVLWPGPQWTSPVGVLPSAGRIAIHNPYFWRNLAIECGVLMPVLALYVALARRKPWRRMARPFMVLAPVWVGFVVWSLHVH